MQEANNTIKNADSLIDNASESLENLDSDAKATLDSVNLKAKDLLKNKEEIEKAFENRHGEKLFETLVNREEMAKAVDLGNYYRIPADNRDLNYGKFFTEGQAKVSEVEDYTSHNTQRLDVEGMKKLLLKLPQIRKDILGEDISNIYEP